MLPFPLLSALCATMSANPANPLIVQGDRSVLVEVDNPRYTEARDCLLGFAELVKSPEHIHTYRITPLSVWNACAAGITPDSIVASLTSLAKFPPPPHLLTEIHDLAARYGRLVLEREGDDLVLVAADDVLAELAARSLASRQVAFTRPQARRIVIAAALRGKLKHILVEVGLPVDDQAGYVEGESLPIVLRDISAAGLPFALRDYQHAAAAAFHAGGGVRGGSGVVVLPCGAGKTVVGLDIMRLVSRSTLILTTGITAVRQWIREICDKTQLDPELVGEYTGSEKQLRPVTVSTYQVMTWRARQSAEFPHLKIFDARDWGLIIYDEVHLLPAPVFQVTASLQARRRLGLTATLVREDGREGEVFALIGPKKAEVPWKELEAVGWLATARCTEVRVPMPAELAMPYAVAESRMQFRIASENPAKLAVVRRLLARHPGDGCLVIGLFVEQLRLLADELGVPLITGATPQKRRDVLYDDFRTGRLRTLVVSKVANFAIDLPDAAVAIQVSGTFGSRQEEAQRLGRILRPKPGNNQAHFYSVVSAETVEQDFALKRQLFLCEQGYEYAIEDVS